MSKPFSKIFLFLFLILFSSFVFAAPSITVDTLDTNDTTPLVTGAFDLNGVSEDANFIVIINELEYLPLYDEIDINYDTNTWELTALELADGIYDVNAMMIIGENTYYDQTTDELDINLNSPTLEIIFNDDFGEEPAPIVLDINDTMLVRFMFNEVVSDFNNDDINLALANGTLTDVNTENDINFLATFTPNPNVEDEDNVIIVNTTGVVDVNNIPGRRSTQESDSFAISSCCTVLTLDITIDDNELNIGDTALVTFTFSDTPTGFPPVGPLSVENGLLSDFNSDNPLIQTAILTPDVSKEDTTNIISVSKESWTDADGNHPLEDSNSPNYAIDTQAPEVEIIFNDNFGEEEGIVLITGQTMLVRFLFTEEVSDFNNDDINLALANGTLTDVNTENDINFLATFTPNPNVEDANNLILINTTGVVDLANN